MADSISENHAIDVAVLAPGETFGGAERQILTLLRGLCRGNAWRPTLWTFYDRELAASARRLGVPVALIGSPDEGSFPLVYRLRQLLATSHTRLVNVHGYRASVLLAMATFRCPVAVVKTEHGLIERGTGGLLKRYRPYVYRLLEVLADRQMKARIVCVTDDLRRRSQRWHHGLVVSVIHNGIEEPPEDVSRPVNLPDGGPILLVLGRLEAVKGIDVAIEAMRSPRMPPNARLLVAGTGPELARLRRHADAAGVVDRVHFLGFCTDPYAYLSHSDVLLMPSRHEGLPYSLLEAMAAGVPIVASNVGGIAEIHRHGQTAMLVAPGAAQEIAEAVDTILRDRTLRASLVDASQDMVKQAFSANKMTQRYADVFGEAYLRVK